MKSKHTKKPKLTVEMIRECVKQLKAHAIKGPITLPMRGDIVLSETGIVVIPGFGWMHLQTFRDIAGEDAYQYLLSKPRVHCDCDEI